MSLDKELTQILQLDVLEVKLVDEVDRLKDEVDKEVSELNIHLHQRLLGRLDEAKYLLEEYRKWKQKNQS